MSDDRELDEIQAIFFEECVEGLGTAAQQFPLPLNKFRSGLSYSQAVL